MISRNEIEAFLAAEKQTVSSMAWRERLSRKDPQWWEYVSAIEIDGVVLEEAEFRVQWRSGKGAAQEKYNCAFLYQNKRIYAVDFEPDGQHTNKVGKGRPLYGQRIGPGTHEHTWSDDGDGYAEPVADFKDLKVLFDYFCAKSKLKVVSGFASPPTVQLSLL